MKGHLLLTAAMFGLCASAALAEAQTGTAAATSAAEFVEKAAMSDMFEIQSGRLASEEAEASEVKSFGEMLVNDHTTSSQELMSTAQSAGVEAEPPASLDERHQQMLDQLQQASGGEFDRLFAEMQTKAHEEGVALFTSYSTNGDNEALKEFASRTLPTLQEHLEMAEKLQEQ